MDARHLRQVGQKRKTLGKNGPQRLMYKHL